MYISYEKIYSLTLSPDSKRVAYVGEDDNREVDVVDGEEQRWYEKIYSLTFSPDSKRVAYVGEDDNREVAVVDGKSSGGAKR